MDTLLTPITGVVTMSLGAPLLALASRRLRLLVPALGVVVGVVAGPDMLGWIEVDMPTEVVVLLTLAAVLVLAGQLRPHRGPARRRSPGDERIERGSRAGDRRWSAPLTAASTIGHDIVGPALLMTLGLNVGLVGPLRLLSDLAWARPAGSLLVAAVAAALLTGNRRARRGPRLCPGPGGGVGSARGDDRREHDASR